MREGSGVGLTAICAPAAKVIHGDSKYLRVGQKG
jgi:hypothetical protein